MKISVVVPSYRRPDALANCLPALLAQERPADEIIVVVRVDDEESRALLGGFPDVTEVTVDQPGAVWAMAQGSLASTGDVIAFTDDDACPSPSWLRRLEATYETDPTIGAVAGHAYNLTTSIGLLGMGRMLVRCAYAVLVGDRAMPGVLRAVILLAQGDRAALTRLRGSLAGNTAALVDRFRGVRPTFVRP